MSDLQSVKEVLPNTPVLANTGVKHETIKDVLRISDGCIVGSSLKFKGDTWQAVDPKRAIDFMQRVKNFRKS
jgi:predicted TIM-barrel enzyme